LVPALWTGWSWQTRFSGLPGSRRYSLLNFNRDRDIPDDYPGLGKRGTALLNVFLTFDVEIWCDDWDEVDVQFPSAFARYVYGRSSKGSFALPVTLEVLQEYGCRGTFFVEPLFACRFGMDPLVEIVRLIRRAGQDVQLHLHPEWTDEARPPILEGATTKRQHLFQYSLEEQTKLVSTGKAMIEAAGVASICAFRAGSYACNRATLQALERNGIRFDSSINPARAWSGTDVSVAERGQRVIQVEGVREYPITVFQDRPGRLRQVQIGSTSIGEMFHLLRQAHGQGRRAFVIVSHNFEMLVAGTTNPDPVVVRRFKALCRFLSENRDDFPTVIFPELPAVADEEEPPVLTSPLWRTGLRAIEQARRRLYR